MTEDYRCYMRYGLSTFDMRGSYCIPAAIVDTEEVILKLCSFEYVLLKYVKSLFKRKILFAIFWDTYRLFWKAFFRVYRRDILMFQNNVRFELERIEAFDRIPKVVMSFLKQYDYKTFR